MKIYLSPDQMGMRNVDIQRIFSVSKLTARKALKRGWIMKKGKNLTPCPEFSEAHAKRITTLTWRAVNFMCRKFGVEYHDLGQYGWEPIDFFMEARAHLLERIGRAKNEKDLINMACNGFMNARKVSFRFCRDAETFAPILDGDEYPCDFDVLDLVRVYSQKGIGLFCKFFGQEYSEELVDTLEELVSKYQMPSRLTFVEKANSYVKFRFCVTSTQESNSGSYYHNVRGKGIVRVSDHESITPREDLIMNLFPGSPDSQTINLK